MARYLKLEVLRVLRNARFLIFTIGFPLGFYLLFVSMYGGAGRVGGLPMDAYFLVSMASFGTLGAALNSAGTRLAIERAGGWTRQLRVTPLSAGRYVATKGLSAMLSAVPGLALVALAAGLLDHLALPFGTWARILAVAWLGALPFATLGILLGYLFDSESAQSGVMVTYFGLSILGGLWIPFQMLPSVLQDIGRALPSYYLVHLGWGTLAGAPPSLRDIGVLAAYAAAFAVLAMWRFRRDEHREYA